MLPASPRPTTATRILTSSSKAFASILLTIVVESCHGRNEGDSMSTIVEGADAATEERVTDVIRGAIVRGEYAPNQRLIEADLSDTFAASRATVRIALLEL